MQRTSILVIGDALLDVYVSGSVGRVSPEAPVPVVLEGSRRSVLGGAANVAANVARFGARAVLAARVGADPEGDELRRLCERVEIDTRALAVGPEPTTRKTRVLAGYQQIVRLDREDTTPAGAAQQDALHAALESFLDLPGPKAVVLADYGKGALGTSLLTRLIASARERGVAVVADPKSADLARYAGVTVLKPNLAEGRSALARVRPGAEEDDVAAVCAAVLELSGRTRSRSVAPLTGWRSRAPGWMGRCT